MQFSLPTLLLLSSLALSSPAPFDTAALSARSPSPDSDTDAATSAATPLQKRKDKVCWITYGANAGCDTTPTSSKRHGVLRPGSVSGPNFGVECWTTGTRFTGNGVTNNVWYYVPANAYQCYVWSGWVDTPCKTGLPKCL